MANNLYSPHPAIKYAQSGLRTIEEKLGMPVEEILKWIEKTGPKAEEARMKWLKSEHGLGTNQASWLAGLSIGKGLEDIDPKAYLHAARGYVENMFSGKKESLRPIYDKLLEVCLAVGKEAKASPCATIIPIFRHHVIAQIKPSTLT